MTDIGVALETLSGAAILPHLDAIARLRIAVFRAWPYLYDGDLGYEREYLAAYAQSPRSILVLARCAGEVVGASTGVPLAEDSAEFQAPLIDGGIDVAQVFYCGESVVLPEHRGRGIGHGFFDAREAHARALGGFAWTAFAAVDRDADDPRRPAGHRGNEAFWDKRGYLRQEGMRMSLQWNEVGVGQQLHALTFWLRPLQADAERVADHGGTFDVGD